MTKPETDISKLTFDREKRRLMLLFVVITDILISLVGAVELSSFLASLTRAIFAKQDMMPYLVAAFATISNPIGIGIFIFLLLLVPCIGLLMDRSFAGASVHVVDDGKCKIAVDTTVYGVVTTKNSSSDKKGGC